MERQLAGRDRDPASYARHALHSEERLWVEKNCYVDIWIELVHALGLDPLAMQAFTIALDFEDDQWTFFKPAQIDLWELYGIDVQEMTVWRPLARHLVDQLARGKLVSTEADSFFLPDTRGTDYRQQHVKTTIVVERIDLERRELRYFHNAGYYELAGDDFDGVLRTGVRAPTDLPLYAELIHVDRMKQLSLPELKRASLASLRGHLARRPTENPVLRFRDALGQQLAGLLGDLPSYHQYAFATLRQMGAGLEVLALYLRWLDEARLGRAADGFLEISATAKALILKGARAVGAKKRADFSDTLREAATNWEAAMTLVGEYAATTANG